MASFLNSARRSMRSAPNPFNKGHSRNFSAHGVKLRPDGWPGPNPYFWVIGCFGVSLIGGLYWKEFQMRDRQFSMAFDKWYKQRIQQEDRQLIQRAFENDEEFKNKSPRERAATVHQVKVLLENLPDEFKTSARYKSIYKLWEPYLPEADLYNAEEAEETEEAAEEDVSVVVEEESSEPEASED